MARAAQNSVVTATDTPPKRRRGTGKPFAPGQSGNPGGRPRGIARRTREIVGQGADDDATVLIQILLSIAANPQAKDADRIRATESLMNRGWGQPPQFAPIEVDDPLEMGERQAAEIAGAFETKMDELKKKRDARAARAG